MPKIRGEEELYGGGETVAHALRDLAVRAHRMAQEGREVKVRPGEEVLVRIIPNPELSVPRYVAEMRWEPAVELPPALKR